MKIETAQDPNGYWFLLVDNMMDCDIPYAISEQGIEHMASIHYPNEVCINTDNPLHLKRQRRNLTK